MLVEWLLIRHLYQAAARHAARHLGLEPDLQQAFRSVFGAREVGVTLPDWMMGSLPLTDMIEVPINGCSSWA
jgi:urea transport system permease protein